MEARPPISKGRDFQKGSRFIMSSGGAPTPEAEKLRPLEGLRGIAALVVVLHHLRLAMFHPEYLAVHASLGSVGRNYLDAVLNGEFAVWLFWVMSAFVLSMRFFRSDDLATARASLTDSALRRYPRLAIPVLGSVLLAWGLIVCGFDYESCLMTEFGLAGTNMLDSRQCTPSFVDAVRSALWDTFFYYESSRSYNSVLWTMEKELFGSWFVFAWLAIVGGLRWRWAGYGLVAIVLEFLSLQWLNAFIAGVVLSDLYVGARSGSLDSVPGIRLYKNAGKSWIVAPILVIVLWFFAGVSNRGPYYVILSSLFVVLTLTSPAVGGMLSSRLMVGLGKISFGLYLVHVPLISGVAWPAYAWAQRAASSGAAKSIAALLVIALSLGVGWLFWFVIDRPAIRLSRWFAVVVGQEGKRT